MGKEDGDGGKLTMKSFVGRARGITFLFPFTQKGQKCKGCPFAGTLLQEMMSQVKEVGHTSYIIYQRIENIEYHAGQ